MRFLQSSPDFCFPVNFLVLFQYSAGVHPQKPPPNRFLETMGFPLARTFSG